MVVPAANAVTKPELFIVATEVLLLVQVPGEVELSRSEVVLIHKVVVPVMDATGGNALTVIFFVSLLVQPFISAAVV